MMSVLEYRGWKIYPTDPVPPIPGWQSHVWTYQHGDYDGPEDARSGTAGSIEECLEAIDGAEGEEEDVPFCYIQKTSAVVGNCAVWWRPNGEGYTCDMRKAGRYPAQVAESIVKGKEEHRAIPCPEVDALAALHVDVSALRRIKP